MSPDEIQSAYDVLTQEVADYGAAEAAKVGNSQRSLGTLAERVASPSGQTNGLANYTYNRALRPTVDSMVAQLTTTGKSQVLTQYLNDSLRAAKQAYEDSQRRYQNAVANYSTGGGGSGSGSGSGIQFQQRATSSLYNTANNGNNNNGENGGESSGDSRGAHPDMGYWDAWHVINRNHPPANPTDWMDNMIEAENMARDENYYSQWYY